MKKAAFITIGEAPRKDIETTYNRYFKDMPNIIQTGLLDGLSKSEANDILGRDDKESYSLISRFLDGSSIIMSRNKVEQRLQQKIDALENEGYDTIVLLCTGDFETLTTAKAQLIEPEKLTIPAVKEMAAGKKVGVMVPITEQISHSKNKWRLGEQGVFCAASPYAFTEESFESAALELKKKDSGLIVLDCMGYSDEMKRFIQSKVEDIPIIQSNELVFMTVAEDIKG